MSTALIYNVPENHHLLIRDKPGMDGGVAGQSDNGYHLEVLGQTGDWYQVKTALVTGYAYGPCLMIDGQPAPLATEGAQVVRLALQALSEGWAYCWGWNGDKIVDEAALKKFGLARKFLGKIGADCSGLITWIEKKRNSGYGDATAEGWYNNRCRHLINAAYLQPGDLPCAADGKGNIYHIGVYIGDGLVVEESGTEYGIRATAMPGGWNRFGRLKNVPDQPNPILLIKTVTANALNVRAGAGVLYKVLGVVHRGDRLTATGRTSGKWVEIKYKAGTGWCSGKYLV